MPRDGSLILSNIRGPTLALVCEPCGRRGRYNVERLMAVAREADRSPENLANWQGALGQLLRAMQSEVRKALASVSILPSQMPRRSSSVSVWIFWHAASLEVPS
jgi:hypothetical protein